MTPHGRETDAIVLNSTEHGESDLIVTLFCQDVGRLTTIAKGAKKSKKRFVNKLELFSFLHISYQLKTNSSLGFLAEAALHSSFLNIRKELSCYSAASVIREFLLLGVKDNAPDIQIFRLSLWALHKIDNKEPPLSVLTLFLIRFFDYIGYRPDLHSCGQCEGVVTNQKRYNFDTSSGRIVCSSCNPNVQRGLYLSQGTIKILQAAQDQPLERLHRLKISGKSLHEAIGLLQIYGNHLFQREIISWQSVQRLLKK